MDKHIKLRPNLVLREEDDGAILFDPDTGGLRILNQTAARICGLLSQEKRIDEVVESLVSEYDVADRATAEKDLLELIDSMREAFVFETAGV